ncbi:pectate lyase superfamily protein-domain-containing protein [Xylogone sp. PMI_703]|nr:pectate lyase superfamily protein-domain-containing protein [Xylogone sp. PMI_703]
MARLSLLLHCICQILALSSIVASQRNRSDPSFPAIPSNFTQPPPRTYSKAQLAQVATALKEAEARFNSSNTSFKLASSNVTITDSLNKHANVSESALAAVRKSRLDNPIRNVYTRKGTANAKKMRSPSTWPISPDTLAAAALLAEVDAAAKYHNGTLYTSYRNSSHITKRTDHPFNSRLFAKRQSTTFWMEEVWRNVKEYGAVGGGVTDDTAAINAAITDGDQCGMDCESSSVKGALVYFPSGQYLVSSTIISYYNTQLVGNAIDVPTIVASASFVGFAVIQSDVYIPNGNGAEWYLDTANFYRQIRNFNIDISGVSAANAIALHWQVAQVTSLQNTLFNAQSGADSTQVSIFAENGSGGFMNDLVIVGGLYGLREQTRRNPVMVIRWQPAIYVTELMVRERPDRNSADLLDSSFESVTTAIFSSPFLSDEQGTTVMVLDNNYYESVDEIVAFSDGTSAGIPTSGYPSFWGHGNTEYEGSSAYGGYEVEGVSRVPALVANSSNFPNGNIYFERDGVTDDTVAINDILAYAASLNTESSINAVVFFPAGTYIVKDTIFVPTNSCIVGECWSQIMASGINFQDQTNPRIMVQVGTASDKPGSVEISGILFTAQGPTAGLIAVQWNSQQYQQGSTDSHFRIGGALGTDLQVADCPILSGTINAKCTAATIMLWLTVEGSGYFENVWAWIADHDLDDPQNIHVDVYGGRGILIESIFAPTWWYGTASEHAVLYQYELFMAQNAFMGMIQTESPYYQGIPSTAAPTPFASGFSIIPGDVPHDGCGADASSAPCGSAYAIKIINSGGGVTIAGAGLYSWFIDYNEACVDSQGCQEQIVYTYGNSGLQVYNLITIGAVEMVSPFGAITLSSILAALNMDANGHPWWSVIGAYLDQCASSPTLTFDAITTGWVSFGDSFSSGPGAGSIWDSSFNGCLRFTQSYPAQLNQTFQRLALTGRLTLPYVSVEEWPSMSGGAYIRCFGAVAPSGFINCSLTSRLEFKMQYLACSGSLTNDAKMQKQLSSWDPTTSDLGTITIGGNDVGFTNILIQCVLHPPGFGTGLFWRTFDCPGALDEAQAAIDSVKFAQNLVALYNSIFERIPDGQKFALYVAGCGQFLDIADESVDDCGTFGTHIYFDNPRLTKDLRTSIDNLVVALNTKIQGLIGTVTLKEGQSITYVDWDADLDGHRFCTPGYSNEPMSDKYEAAHNYFFYLNGADNYPGEEDNWPKNPSIEPPPAPLIAPPADGVYSIQIDPTACNSSAMTSAYDFENIWCVWANQALMNSSYAAQFRNLDNLRDDDSLMNLTVTWTDDVLVVASNSGGPSSSTARTFHPRTMGHKLIANAIVNAITANG